MARLSLALIHQHVFESVQRLLIMNDAADGRPERQDRKAYAPLVFGKLSEGGEKEGYFYEPPIDAGHIGLPSDPRDRLFLIQCQPGSPPRHACI